MRDLTCLEGRQNLDQNDIIHTSQIAGQSSSSSWIAIQKYFMEDVFTLRLGHYKIGVVDDWLGVA
jgi:hypothetical protein